MRTQRREYLPPEIVGGGDVGRVQEALADSASPYFVSKAVDLWAVGILAYNCLTGEYPFIDGNSCSEHERRIHSCTHT
eukprot:COSAG01_NODE_2126_length_8367_cov_3.977866_12_plen_78_part_00